MKKRINISGVSETYSRNIHEVSSKLFESGFLISKKIGISVSESEDMEELGLSDFHIKDATIEITRYLLAQGAKLIYGGDLRKDGFTRLFSELSFQYRNNEFFYFGTKQIELPNEFECILAKHPTGTILKQGQKELTKEECLLIWEWIKEKYSFGIQGFPSLFHKGFERYDGKT